MQNYPFPAPCVLQPHWRGRSSELLYGQQIGWRMRLTLILSISLIAAVWSFFVPQTAFAQSPSDWQFQLEELRVIEAQEDTPFLEDGDEPYFIVIHFGVRYAEPGSAYVSWSSYLEENWADGVLDNDVRTIPPQMGTVSYTDMEIITRDHFVCDDIMPEGGGALVIAMEHDFTPWDVVRDVVADLEDAIEAELANLVADANIDLANAEAEVTAAIDRVVDSVSYDFWRSAEIVALSAGNPDDFINYHAFVFGAAEARVKDELAIPVVPQTVIDVFANRQFEPLIFAGDGATYEVTASLFATQIAPTVQVAGTEIHHAAPLRVGVPSDFAATVAQGSDVIYDWDWGDGATGLCANASHVYSHPGLYTVTVTASNAQSAETRTVVVEVADLAYHLYLPNIVSNVVVQ